MSYASAAINTISIPGHIMFGINQVDPAIATIPIPSDKKHALGKATATTAWDMLNAVLAASAVLNVQRSKLGVRTLEGFGGFCADGRGLVHFGVGK